MFRLRALLCCGRHNLSSGCRRCFHRCSIKVHVFLTFLPKKNAARFLERERGLRVNKDTIRIIQHLTIPFTQEKGTVTSGTDGAHQTHESTLRKFPKLSKLSQNLAKQLLQTYVLSTLFPLLPPPLSSHVHSCCFASSFNRSMSAFSSSTSPLDFPSSHIPGRDLSSPRTQIRFNIVPSIWVPFFVAHNLSTFLRQITPFFPPYCRGGRRSPSRRGGRHFCGKGVLRVNVATLKGVAVWISRVAPWRT